MQNRYVGDIHDYRKYGLLRIFRKSGFKNIHIVWKLTDHDEEKDGNKREYLKHPDKWRKFDRALYSKMKRLDQERPSFHENVTEERNQSKAPLIEWIEKKNVIKNAVYHPYSLDNSETKRKIDLVFFDPDNGIEVKSTGKGKAYKDKYVLWSEIRDAWNRGASVLVYQHFPRVKREPYIKKLAEDMSKATDGSLVIAYRTPNVLFLLAVQKKHEKRLKAISERLSRWGSQLWEDVSQTSTQLKGDLY